MYIHLTHVSYVQLRDRANFIFTQFGQVLWVPLYTYIIRLTSIRPRRVIGVVDANYIIIGRYLYYTVISSKFFFCAAK